MFPIHRTFVLLTFLNILLGTDSLIELPKYDVRDLITTEEIIRNCTNGILSSLRLKRPLNETRIKDYATAHHYFLSITFQDSDVLQEIARLTRVDTRNNTVENFTTILNEILEENTCDINASDGDSDDTVVTYIDSFLARLNELKEIYGVNKVFSDINSNIINIFREARELDRSVKEKEIVNSSNVSDNNFNVFDSDEYWAASGRRIFRGKRTKIKYYPFMASIHIMNNFQCAGSIIKSDLIVTASSCLQLAWNNRFYRENPAFLSVRVGSSFYDGGGDKIPVLEIYFHPSYHPKTLRNNICIVRLLRHIKFRRRDRRKVQKIMIDNNPWPLPINTPGITIVGWGAKGRGNSIGNPFTNILSYDILDIYPLKDCQDVFSKEYVTVKNFCGGFFSKGGGACNRDVGAPGIVDGLLMGVVSFGSPVCGTPDVPTVFTKLGYYYDWIRNIMNMDVPHSKKRTTLLVTEDPYAPYMTTPYTTTTFKIEPVPEGASPIPVLEVDEEKALRMLDNKLFQEFIDTMFGGNDYQKYQFLMDRAKNKLKKEISRQKVGTLEKAKIMETTKKPILGINDESDTVFEPVTVGYESDDDISRTVPVPFDNDELTTDESSAEKYTSKHRVTNYVPTKKYTRKIGRHEISYDIPQKENEIKFPALTNAPEEILLELATESSDDSNDSDDLQEEDTDKPVSIKYNTNDSSLDISDMPGEQAIAELLDEIDLHQLFKGVSEESKKTSEKNTKAHEKTFYVTARVPLKKQEKDNLRGNNKLEMNNEQEEDSVLTLLFLSDNEKRNNLLSDSENAIKIDNGKKRDLDYRDNIYDIVPKNKLYKIIAEVIEAATKNT